MRIRHVFVVAFVGLGPFVLDGCSSDSTTFTPVQVGGEGGEASGRGGSGASSGTSGASSGKGGSGASSGKGGSGAGAGEGGGGGSGGEAGDNAAGGDAGAAQGGSGAAGGEGGQSAGMSGSTSGGDAGSGAISGGGGDGAGAGEAGEGGAPGAGGAAAGGEGGGHAGSGQSAGEGGAGAGGRGTPEELKHCAYECSTDEECASPGIIEYVCDTLTNRCAAPDLACDGHRDCVAFASSWTVACEKDEDCLSAADVCVEARGAGRCARAFAEDTPCPLPDQVALPRARFGDPGEVVQVCGRTNGRCGDGTCFLGCTGAGDCGEGQGDTCDSESGRCTCSADNECTSGAISHCNPDTQRCDECASDFDCFLDVTRDRCVDGRCGCSSAEVCLDLVFPDATPVCE